MFLFFTNCKSFFYVTVLVVVLILTTTTVENVIDSVTNLLPIFKCLCLKAQRFNMIFFYKNILNLFAILLLVCYLFVCDFVIVLLVCVAGLLSVLFPICWLFRYQFVICLLLVCYLFFLSCLSIFLRFLKSLKQFLVRNVGLMLWIYQNSLYVTRSHDGDVFDQEMVQVCSVDLLSVFIWALFAF